MEALNDTQTHPVESSVQTPEAQALALLCSRAGIDDDMDFGQKMAALNTAVGRSGAERVLSCDEGTIVHASLYGQAAQARKVRSSNSKIAKRQLNELSNQVW